MTEEIEENVKHDPHLEAQWDAWMATNPLADIPDDGWRIHTLPKVV